MRKVLILNNFGMLPINPPNSTSKVCNLLRKYENMVVVHMDVNLLLWKALLSVEFLRKCEYHEERLLHSEVSFCPKISLSTFEVIKVNVIKNINRALGIIRNKEEFRNTDTLSWAVNVIFQAQQVIYFSYGTFIHNKMIFWPHIGSDTNNLEEVFRLSEDREHNPFIELMEEIIVPKLVQYQPDIIGIDVLFPWEIVQTITLNKLIRLNLPETHINFIGYGFDEFCFSRIAKNMVVNKRLMLGFDSVFLVRNDKSLVNLYMDSNVDMEQLNSIAYFDKDFDIIIVGPLYENVIEENIIPDYSDLDLADYFSPEIVFTDKLSNKCFWNKCSFCNINKFKSERCEIKIEKYLDDIQNYVKRYQCKNLFLLDEAATPILVQQFAKGLLERNIEITWSIRTRIDVGFDENLIALMYRAGCREMWIGFEAASKRILQYMNKTDDPEAYLEVAKNEMKLCQTYGIGLHFCMILGFPNELEEDRQELMKFFEQNRQYISKVPFFVTYNIFNLNTETYIYDHYEQFGIKKINYDTQRFNMINIPFVREDTGKDQKDMELRLEPFCEQLTNVFVRNIANQLLWFTIADSSWEMLFKKYNNQENPFQQEASGMGKLGIKLYTMLSKSPICLKVLNRLSDKKIGKQKSILYH